MVPSPQPPPPTIDAEKTKALFARISGKEIGDGPARVALNPGGIFIHPGESRPTRVQFRLGKSVEALTLAGYIGQLPAEARSVAQAATVSLALNGDGKIWWDWFNLGVVSQEAVPPGPR